VSAEDIDAARSAFATGGWPAAVRVALDAPTGIGKKRSFAVADLLAQIGETDKAFDVLDEMRKARAIMMVDVPRDPMLDPIRDDPRYTALLSDMNLK
jgi:pentatricopeptide repeat protein